MSFGRIGLDFLGGAGEGVGQGATISAGLKAAGFSNPYAVPLMAGLGGLSAMERILQGLGDKKADRMNIRLGEQEIAMNDQALEAKRRLLEEDRKAKQKNRALQDMLSGIFGRYSKTQGGP